MLLSMTGVAKVAIPHKGATIIIELQSLNRKGLEIHISLPEELQGLDFELRKKIQEKLSRGTIQLRVYFKAAEERSRQNGALESGALKEEYTQLKEIATSLGLEKPTLADLLLFIENRRKVHLQKEVSLETQNALLKGIDDAVEELIFSRSREGKELLRDFATRIDHLGELVNTIEKLKEASRQEIIRKLQLKYDELFSSLKDNNLLYRELVLFVEKTDITEEIVRFRGHLTAIKALFEKKEKTPGKTLEFYVHELQREASTMAAKCLDPEIGHATIEIRSELERIREQLQNVE